MKTVALAALLVTVPLAHMAAADTSALLPDAAAVDGWRPTDTSSYDASTLSHLIDGGAEVYLDYGFVRAVTADYASGEDTVTCTVYEMRDATAAFGVFSYFRSSDKPLVTVGDAGFGGESQVALWQDRYFATVETFSTDLRHRDALQVFARAISTRIAAHASTPALLARLPAGRVTASEKLLRGRLATNALYTAWPSAPVSLGDAALLAARYPAPGGEVTVWILPLANEAAVETAWAGTVSKLRPDAGCADADPAQGQRAGGKGQNGAVACVRDGKVAAARAIGNTIAIVSGAATLQQATALLDRVAR